MLDSIAGSPATDTSVAGIIKTLLQIDLCGTGGTDMEQRVLDRFQKDFQVGAEDCNDVLSPWQGIRCMKDPQLGPSFEVSQERAIEELDQIPVEKNIEENIHCTPTMHAKYWSLLGQIYWLHSRTQFHCCYKFSRCASRAASPTIGDVKALNKLARQLKSQPVKLQFWPLTGPLIIIGFYWCLLPKQCRRDLHREAWQYVQQNCESIPRRMEWHVEVLLTTKVETIKRNVLSTTVAGLCTFMKGLWVHTSFSLDCG